MEIANPAIPKAGIIKKPNINIAFKTELKDDCIKKIKVPRKIMSVYYIASKAF